MSDDERMTTYGFIGLGAMGTPMAINLARAAIANGDHLLVWNRTQGRAEPVERAGGSYIGDPAGVVADSEVVIVMLPDLPQLQELTDGPSALLSRVTRPTVLVVCSSVSPASVRDYAKHAARMTDGLVEVIDAPVSGGAEGAAEGSLAIMVGGPEAAVQLAWPALTAMGTTVRHLGPVGSGALTKACNQLVVAATLVALSEASVLAEAAGVDIGGLFDILAGGFGASRVLDVKRSNLTSRTYEPTGMAIYMVKDLGFVAAEARRTGTPIPQAALSAELFAEVAVHGLGEQDVSVVHAVIRDQRTDTA